MEVPFWGGLGLQTPPEHPREGLENPRRRFRGGKSQKSSKLK